MHLIKGWTDFSWVLGLVIFNTKLVPQISRRNLLCHNGRQALRSPESLCSLHPLRLSKLHQINPQATHSDLRAVHTLIRKAGVKTSWCPFQHELFCDHMKRSCVIWQTPATNEHKGDMDDLQSTSATHVLGPTDHVLPSEKFRAFLDSSAVRKNLWTERLQNEHKRLILKPSDVLDWLTSELWARKS